MSKKAHLVARCAIVTGYFLELNCCAHRTETIAKLMLVAASAVLLTLWLTGEKDATE